MKCPNCSLENPPGAERCDCGFDFAAQQMKKPYVGPPSSDLKRNSSATSSTLLNRMFAVEGTGIDIAAILGVVACVVLTAKLQFDLKSFDSHLGYLGNFAFGITAGPLLGLTIGLAMKLMGDQSKSMSIVHCMLLCSVAVFVFIILAAMGAGI